MMTLLMKRIRNSQTLLPSMSDPRLSKRVNFHAIVNTRWCFPCILAWRVGWPFDPCLPLQLCSNMWISSHSPALSFTLKEQSFSFCLSVYVCTLFLYVQLHCAFVCEPSPVCICVSCVSLPSFNTSTCQTALKSLSVGTTKGDRCTT